MIAPGCNSMDAQRHLDFGNGCLSRGSHSSLIDSREGRQSHPCRKLPNQNTLLPRGHDQQCNQCHPVEIRRRTRFSYQRLPLPKEHLELWGLSEQRCPLVAPSQSSHLGCCQTQFGFGIHAKTFGSYPAPWQRKEGGHGKWKCWFTCWRLPLSRMKQRIAPQPPKVDSPAKKLTHLFNDKI